MIVFPSSAAIFEVPMLVYFAVETFVEVNVLISVNGPVSVILATALLEAIEAAAEQAPDDSNETLGTRTPLEATTTNSIASEKTTILPLQTSNHFHLHRKETMIQVSHSLAHSRSYSLSR